MLFKFRKLCFLSGKEQGAGGKRVVRGREQGAGGKRVVRSWEQPTHDKSGRCSRALRILAPLRSASEQSSSPHYALRITHYALSPYSSSPIVFNSFNSLNSFNSKKRSEFIDVGASNVQRPINLVLAKITIYIIMFARYYSTTIFS